MSGDTPPLSEADPSGYTNREVIDSLEEGQTIDSVLRRRLLAIYRRDTKEVPFFGSPRVLPYLNLDFSISA
jgi:hypothetical protein